MNKELRAIISLPDFTAALTTLGMTPAYSTSEQFRAMITKDVARWAAVAKTQNLKQQD